jgi:hypothetical protein
MHGGNYCVAGWEGERGAMVRPLPGGHNWTLALLKQNRVKPGTVITLRTSGKAHRSAFPHATEDCEIDAGSIRNTGAEFKNWFGRDAPARERTLAAAFGAPIQHNSIWQGVRQSAHIRGGTNCRSLWGLETMSAQLRFVEHFGKLKAVIVDPSGSYQIAVAGAELKRYYKNNGLDGVNSLLIAPRRLHLRLGLARPFEQQEDKCYCLLNGIQW